MKLLVSIVANHPPIHPATLARSVRAVGSPQSCVGARDRRSSVSGRFPNKNLVWIDPQSKRFFLRPAMSGAHGSRRTTIALAMPEKSYRGGEGASPAAAKKRADRRRLLKPSSTARIPSGAAIAAHQRQGAIAGETVAPAVEREGRIEETDLGISFQCR